MLLEQRTVSPSEQTWCTYIYVGFVIFSRGSVSTQSSALSLIVWFGFFVRITIHVHVKTHSHPQSILKLFKIICTLCFITRLTGRF